MTMRSPGRRATIRHRGPWRTLDSVEPATLEWIDRFIHRRRPEPVGSIPPTGTARFDETEGTQGATSHSNEIACDKLEAIQYTHLAYSGDFRWR